MEIRVYDSSLMLLGIVENYTSFIWHRRYCESGDFELHTPATAYLTSLLCVRGRIVTYKGAGEAGVIESIQVEDSEDNDEIVVKGRFLTSWMTYRVNKGTTTFDGLVEVGMRKLLDDIDPPIPNVELGELSGLTATTSFQTTYTELYEYEVSLAASFGYGFKFVPDFETKKIYFIVYEGLDKTRTNGERAFVEFSDDFNNLTFSSYFTNDQLLKNVGYVGGQGEGEDRVVVEIGDTTSTGLDRREVFVDARDIEQEEGMSASEYRALLAQRGREKMNDFVLAETFECETEPNINFVYRQDYDIGDIVTVRKEAWSVTRSLRITEIMEVYENERAVITPVFGDDLVVNGVTVNTGGGGSGGGGTGTVTTEPVGQGQYEEPLIQIANGGTGARTAVDAILSLSVYPVGSIYMSVNSTDPSILFGGTWERIQDTFLLAAGSTYAAGDTGGEAEHTLTTDEMPSHSHFQQHQSDTSYVGIHVKNYNSGGSIQGVQPSNGTRRNNIADPSTRVPTVATGGGQAHNNMPPYIAVYVWKRVS